MATKTTPRQEHPINTGEHACNDPALNARMAAYHRDRPPLAIKLPTRPKNQE